MRACCARLSRACMPTRGCDEGCDPAVLMTPRGACPCACTTLGRSALLQPVLVQSTLRDRPCQLFGLACVSLLLLCKRPATSLFTWPLLFCAVPIQAVCVCAAVKGCDLQVQHASGSPGHMSFIMSCNGVQSVKTWHMPLALQNPHLSCTQCE